jgi:hypothetical protein
MRVVIDERAAVTNALALEAPGNAREVADRRSDRLERDPDLQRETPPRVERGVPRVPELTRRGLPTPSI